MKKIAVLAGDGIGPEVTAEAGLLIQAVAEKYDLTLDLQTELIGGAAIDATGEPLPQQSLDACRAADAIILGPGSLYTSILPNLLVSGIADEIAASPAVKIYVCNVMTQPGETDEMGLAEHVRVIREHTRPDLIQYVLVNTEEPGKVLLQRYREMNAAPVLAGAADIEQLDKDGITLVRTRLAGGNDFFRHDPGRLARAILKLIVI